MEAKIRTRGRKKPGINEKQEDLVIACRDRKPDSKLVEIGNLAKFRIL